MIGQKPITKKPVFFLKYEEGCFLTRMGTCGWEVFSGSPKSGPGREKVPEYADDQQ